MTSDAARRDIRLVRPHDDEWPAALPRCTADAAPAGGLWVRGTADLGALLQRAVTIVGASDATPQAVDVAHQLSCDLSATGWTLVTSGQAGVAAGVQLGALSVGRPVVVLPLGGLTRPEPLGHARRFKRITRRGLLVSQSPDHPPSRDSDRAEQSRLLASAAAAVVLIEPPPAGMTGAVVRLARQLGRPLLAVPGPVTSSASGFAHQLIRDGAARLVRDAADVLADLSDDPRKDPS